MIGIEFQNLSFSYTHQPIFSNISSTLSSGQKIQITGDNGAGKTTFLKLACSLLKPISGSIRYFDTQLDLDLRSARKNAGISFDDSHLLRNFSVFENLSLYQKLYTGTTSSEKIIQWLTRFGLQSYRETPVQYLSQGEQKKVSLIKAFIHEPKILVFDEPTNSLDVDSKKILSELFTELSNEHLLLVSTHDHEWSKTWSNREIKIGKGKIL